MFLSVWFSNLSRSHGFELFETMGLGNTKQHPKTVELLKLKKKYNTQELKKAKLTNVWIIGASKSNTLEIAKALSNKLDYLLVSEQELVKQECESGSERGKLIQDIVNEQPLCPGIVLDLATEYLLDKIEGLKGVIYHGIPRDKEQAWHLKKIVGSVAFIVYSHLKGEALEQACGVENNQELTKKNVQKFKKSINNMLRNSKKVLKVEADSEIDDIINKCMEKLEESKKTNCAD